MKLLACEMNRVYAAEILKWKYTKPYDFYNNEKTDQAMEEMQNGSYFAVLSDQNELIGFFCTGYSAQVPAENDLEVYSGNCIDFGLGMKPDLTGKGQGYEFCSYIINWLHEAYQDPIRLTVATFNKRAIHLYEKLGFVMEREFYTKKSNFWVMVKGIREA